MRRIAFGLALFATLASGSLVDAAELVTSCGQRVVDGVLGADLDCSGVGGDTVQVEHSLDLAGFTLTFGAPSAGSPHIGVRCVERGIVAEPGGHVQGKCSVAGPGIVRGTDDGFSYGVSGSKVSIDGVTLEGSMTYAVMAARVALLSNASLTDVSGNGVYAGKTKITNSSISGCGGSGVTSRRVSLIGSSVTGGAVDGVVSGGSVTLSDSNVTGNAADPVACEAHWSGIDCSGGAFPWICADISARKRIRLKDASSCGTSLVQDGQCGDWFDGRSGASHGTCTSD